MDISGAEPRVIKGMSSILNKNDSLKIQQEWWPNAIRTHGNEPDSHLKLLTQMDYKIYEIDGANNKLNLMSMLTFYFGFSSALRASQLI